MFIHEYLGSIDLLDLPLKVIRGKPSIRSIGSRSHEDSRYDFWNCTYGFILKAPCSGCKKCLNEFRYTWSLPSAWTSAFVRGETSLRLWRLGVPGGFSTSMILFFPLQRVQSAGSSYIYSSVLTYA